MPFFNLNLQMMLFRLPALIIALTFHEFAHGFAAYLLGDITAKRDGRLSFNPLKHIDPLGMILIIVAGFGWAKPVMVNPYNLKNPKQDMAIIAVAGPIANFILAFLFMLLFVFLDITIGRTSANINLFRFVSVLVQINIVLGVFNLLPIPPLDGSKLFGILLPDQLYFRYISFRYGFFILMILIFTGTTASIMSPFMEAIINVFSRAALFIFSFL